MKVEFKDAKRDVFYDISSSSSSKRDDDALKRKLN
jgi:hypothetical protein